MEEARLMRSVPARLFFASVFTGSTPRARRSAAQLNSNNNVSLPQAGD